MGFRQRALAVLAMVATTHAQANAPLKLEDLLQSVERHYPLIQAAQQDLERTGADQLTARGGFDPTLRFGYQMTPLGEYENRVLDLSVEQPTPFWGARLVGGFRFGRGKFGAYDGKLQTNEGGEVRAGLELPVLRGRATDERRVRLLTADAQTTAAGQGLLLQRLEFRRLAALRYYDWLAASARLDVARALTALAKQRDQVLHHRVRTGDAARMDADDNARSVIQREAAEIAAVRALDRASLELSLYYRDSVGRPVRPLPEQCPRDWESALETSSTDPNSLTENHPEIRRLRAQMEVNQAELSLAENSILPRLDLELLAAQDLGDGSVDRGRFETKAAIKLEWPLLMRVGRGRKGSAEAAGRRIESQLALASDRLAMQVEDQRRAVLAARERFDAAQREIQLALSVERAEHIRIAHGDSHILQVNLREQATADARGRLIDARFDYLRANAELRAAQGRLE